MNNYTILRSIKSTVLLSPHSKINYKQHNNYNWNWNSSSVVRFRQLQFTTVSSKPDNMDKTQKNNPDDQKSNNENDVMSHSFGEGYATRSDEEGFGGIYGGNQQLPNNNNNNNNNEKHPDYDKSQGSEVKEKEKGRHQTNSDS